MVSDKLKRGWIGNAGQSNYMTVEGGKIICRPCGMSRDWKNKSEFDQHIKTSKHKENAERYARNKKKQTTVQETINNDDETKEFNMDLSQMLVETGIPWIKVNHPSFRKFMDKYLLRRLPEQSTVRKNYLPKIHSKALAQIRRRIGDKPIFVFVDETTDACNRCIANVLVGPLEKTGNSMAHLISSKVIEKTNNETIKNAVIDALTSIDGLWPGAKVEDVSKKFLLLVTDGVAYMKKAGRSLKGLYGKLLHVTCIAHGVNLAIESVRGHFSLVDQFIANMKKAFKKAPSRISIYKENCPNLPLPPQPVVTRWGTWLDAAEFYALNFQMMVTVIQALPEDSAAVKKVKALILQPELPIELSQVSAHFSFLSTKMKQIQERGMSLKRSFELLDEVDSQLKEVTTTIGKAVSAKLTAVITKNPDLKVLRDISSVLNDDGDVNLKVCLSPAELAALKYAPLTTCDAERSFSLHKYLLSARRRSLAPRTLEMEIVCHYEFFISEPEELDNQEMEDEPVVMEVEEN